jgi:predicted nucleotide-binding protein
MDTDNKAQEAIKIIESQLSELSSLFESTRTGRDFDTATEKLVRWKTRTIRLLSDKISHSEGSKLEQIRRNWVTYDKLGDFKHDVDKYSAFLYTLKEELKSHPEDIFLAEIKQDTTTLLEEKAKISSSRVVFIVHGHDDAIKQSTARFLERLDLKPLILHEQPNKGRTIIEKLEASASEVDVRYAVILLTPDDIGADASEKDKSRPRARQNVVFELGYFIAKLGRNRVSALYCEGVELPSDYQGVLYTKIDSAGAWQMELAREIKAAGIDIDLNKLV